MRPGERYKLEVRFANTGAAPIEIAGMVVTTTVNGRNASGAGRALGEHGRPGAERAGPVALRHAARGPAQLVARGAAAHDPRRDLPQPARLERPGRAEALSAEHDELAQTGSS